MLELFLNKISDLLELECSAKVLYSERGEEDQLLLDHSSDKGRQASEGWVSHVSKQTIYIENSLINAHLNLAEIHWNYRFHQHNKESNQCNSLIKKQNNKKTHPSPPKPNKQSNHKSSKWEDLKTLTECHKQKSLHRET